LKLGFYRFESLEERGIRLFNCGDLARGWGAGKGMWPVLLPWGGGKKKAAWLFFFVCECFVIILVAF